MGKLYDRKELQEKLNLGSSQVLDLCKLFGAEKKGNSYVVTEEIFQMMVNRPRKTRKDYLSEVKLSKGER